MPAPPCDNLRGGWQNRIAKPLALDHDSAMPTDTRPFQAIDPTSGVASDVVAFISGRQAAHRVVELAADQRRWAARSMEGRAAALVDLAGRLEEAAPRLAETMAQEMGKPLAEGRAEVRKSARMCRYAAANSPAALLPTAVDAAVTEAAVHCAPLGVVLAVMPWNFPFWQLFRVAAPTWMAGNGVALKHAPNVPGCAEAIVELCGDLPFANFFVDEAGVGELIDHPAIAAVTLTGSTAAGRAVAARAGAAIKPTVLELGGSDPFLVLRDAELQAAAQEGAASRLLNAGQSCIAAKRFIVVEAVAETFLAALRAELSAARVGDPRDAETTVGPLARSDLRTALHRQVSASVAAGARCEMGGRLPDGPGWFYPVTLLTNVAPGMPAWDEELFGPIACVRVVADADAAVAAANDTAYGLGASLWTADPVVAGRLAGELNCGNVFINGMTRSDPRLPFGGVGLSGYGRELGAEGLRSFVNIKTVWRA
jgi:succinate-semialdehyde dehydrogenase/glutarate-semialdehyde dehydrogenase